MSLWQTTDRPFRGGSFRCPRCTSYVCARCWNQGQRLCLTCSPETAAEAQAAQQRGLNDLPHDAAFCSSCGARR